MPLPLKAAIAGALTLLVGGALFLVVQRGPAILLDITANAAAFICL